jgi:anti-sigma regulatory factor (Ser/Thr protein kinase)
MTTAEHHHAVAFYDQDPELVALVAGMTVSALEAGDRVVLVATASHRAAIDLALRDHGIDASERRATGHLVSLDAAALLAAFMVDGVPDKGEFDAHVGGVLREAATSGSGVRAFGEMVALLWDTGNVTGALQLESLWHDLLATGPFELLCAYPTSSMDTARLADIADVCDRHSEVLHPASYTSDHTIPAGSQHSRVFLPVPEAVAAARGFVTGVLERWREDDLVEDAALLTSELATNAVLHARSPFRVSVDRSIGVFCIAIQDLGTAGAEQPPPVVATDLNGRGLAIIEAVARRWGCDFLPGSKVVWAELVSTT